MVIGDEWVLVENPKTGSSSMRQALLAMGADYAASKHTPLTDPQIAPARRLRFVVVRNPYDRMVSAWKHNVKLARPDEPFEDWLLGPAWEAGVGLDIKRVPQTVWAWKCNVILRFENIDAEWARMLNAIGLPHRPLPRVNVGDRPPYQEVYTPRTRQIVEDRFGADLDRWGYSFDEVRPW